MSGRRKADMNRWVGDDYEVFRDGNISKSESI